MLYLVVRRIWKRRIALLATALAAIYPPLVVLSTELYSENLFIPLLLASLLCVLRYRESAALRWAVAAGALAGLVALTRGPGVIVLGPLLYGLWSLRPRFGAGSLVAPAVGIACAALVVAPWAIRNAGEFGGFVPIATSSGFALAGTYSEEARDDPEDATSWRNPITVPEFAPLFEDPEIDEAELDSELREDASEFARENPGYVAEVAFHNGLRLFLLEGDSVVSPDAELTGEGIGNRGGPLEGLALAIVFVLACVGVWTLARGRTGRISKMPRGPLFLWLIPIVLLLAAAVVAGLPRYRLPADPFLLILAAIGIVALLDSRRKALPPALAGFAAVVVLAGCGGGGDTTAAEADPAPPTAEEAEYIEAADRICSEANAGAARVVDEFQDNPRGGSTLEGLSKGLVAPGIEVRAEQAERLRELEPPASDPDLDEFIGLFDPIEEISRLRLESGLSGDADAAARLDLVLDRLTEEQVAAAKAYGFDDCSADVLSVAFQ